MAPDDFQAVASSDFRLAFCVFRRAWLHFREQRIDAPFKFIVECDFANLAALLDDSGGFGLVHAVDRRVVRHLGGFDKPGVESPSLAASFQH